MTGKGSEENKSNGRWSREEHQKFMLGMQLYGKDWKKIQTLIGTRNGAQIRSHAQKFFIKLKKQSENHELNDHWEQTKESPLENTASPTTFQSQTKTQYSYYLNKIVEKAAFQHTFDFWASLVDHKPCTEFEMELNHTRKSSFVSIGLQNGDFEELQPLRKIKCQ